MLEKNEQDVRDEFAGLAMQAPITSAFGQGSDTVETTYTAKASFEFAESMISERRRRIIEEKRMRTEQKRETE